jgi:hypothetical protein
MRSVRKKKNIYVKKQEVVYTVCVHVYASVDLVIQHAELIWRIVLSVESPALPYFYTLFYKQHDFRKNINEYKTRVLIFSTNFIWNISILIKI